jgi:hypothetical protein
MWPAVLAAVESEILAHHPNGLRLAGLEITAQLDRLPEPAHEAAG